MERKTLKDFHKGLSWSTRIYTLMVVVTIALSMMLDAWSENWTLTIVGAIAVVLFVETFAIAFHQHPKTWRMIRLIVFLILLALLLIATIGAG